MKYLALVLIPVLAVACTQRNAAPVEYRGGYYFGKEGAYDRRGNELPRYSSYNPAPETEYHADKFVGEEERYGVSAEIGDVSASELPPPEPIESRPLEPATSSQSGDYDEWGQPTQSVTVTPDESVVVEQTPEVQTAYAPPPAPVTTPLPPKETAGSFIWPLRGEIVSRFGKKQGGQVNDGINIKAREGEPIRASADGIVVYSDDEISGYGNMVIIQHPGGYLTAYAHASELVVKKGDDVVKGQLIGFVGKTGNVNTAQLHYSIRQNKRAVDPESVLVSD